MVGGGGGVQTKSERPNFLCPYLPVGGGGHRRFGQCPKYGSFFLWGVGSVVVETNFSVQLKPKPS